MTVIRIRSGEKISRSIAGATRIVVDVSNAEPSNAKAYGGYVHYMIEFLDRKERCYGNHCYDGLNYMVILYSNGVVQVALGPVLPDMTKSMKGIGKPLGWLAGVLVVYEGRYPDTGRIVFDIADEKLYAGGITIPLYRDYKPVEMGAGGPSSPPVFSGYIEVVVEGVTAKPKPKPKPSPRIAGTIRSGVFNRLVYRGVSCDRISVSGDYDYIVLHASKRVGGEVRSTGYEYTEEKPVTVLLGGGTGDVVLDVYVPAGTTELEVSVCGDTYMYRVVGAGAVKPRLYDLLLRMVGEELYADIVYSSKLPEDTQYIIKKWVDGGYAGEEQGVAPAGSLVVEKQVLPAVPAGRHTVRVCVTSTGTTLCREATVSGEVAPAPPSKPPRKLVSKPLVPLPRITLPPRNIPQKEFLELIGLALASATPVIIVAGTVMSDITSR